MLKLFIFFKLSLGLNAFFYVIFLYVDTKY